VCKGKESGIFEPGDDLKWLSFWPRTLSRAIAWNDRALQVAEKLVRSHLKRQGTTSVVPQTHKQRSGL
jgi:hypothetical protein